MEDLLKEEEFIKAKEFRLLRHVLLYSLIVLVQLTLLFLSINYISQDTASDLVAYLMRAWIVLNVFSPLGLAFMMVFYNKKMILLPLKTIFYALACLAFAYVIAFLGVSHVDALQLDRATTPEDYFIPLGVGCGILLLYSIIILPIANYKKKKML